MTMTWSGGRVNPAAWFDAAGGFGDADADAVDLFDAVDFFDAADFFVRLARAGRFMRWSLRRSSCPRLRRRPAPASGPPPPGRPGWCGRPPAAAAAGPACRRL